MNHSDEILIIGGGVIGICAAFYLLERGYSVTVIEKGEIGDGCSYGNGGLICPSHSIPLAAPGVWKQGLKWMLNPESPLYIKPRLDIDLARWLWQFLMASSQDRMQRGAAKLAKLAHGSLALYSELAALDGMNFGFEQAGGLALFTNPANLEKSIHEADILRQHGVEVQVLDAEGVRQIEPHVAPAVIGGILYPQDAHITPNKFVRQLGQLVEQRGARLLTATEVLGFEKSGRRISAAITTRGTLQAHEFVVASGAWSPVVTRGLGIRLPVQPAKGYSITVKKYADAPRLPVHLSESKIVVTPMGDTLRFAGTLELAGFDSSINQRRVDAISGSIGRYLSGAANLELVELWRGWRPLTPDTLPIIERSPLYDNVTVATGHGMLGMSLGPITGKLVAQIMSGETIAVLS